MAVSTSAFAQTSVEGAAIGDQGFYWITPAEVWIFPHRLGNNDNEVMLQYGASSSAAPLYNLHGLPTYDGAGASSSSIQGGVGGGFVLEVMSNLNLGMWISAYQPETNGFVDRAVTRTGWDTYVGPGATANLQGVDPYTANIEAGRKLDLFGSYWLPDLGVEAGMHLWWGSAHHKSMADDSTGPINIDKDSNPATGDALGIDSANDKLGIKESNYGLSDFGIGLGAGYTGMAGMRADLGLDLNFLGVDWEPNGISDYLDAGGFGFGLNMRGHYDLSDILTVGAFVRYAQSGMSFKPKRQRDGGTLPEMYRPTDPDILGNLPDPGPTPVADPTLPGNENAPVNGITYGESGRHFQVAGLVQVKPNSRAKLYAALGTRYEASTAKLSVGSDWYLQQTVSHFTLPFVHLGFEGKVMNHLNMLLGATKQWRGDTTKTTGYDSRIPDNNDAQGNAGTQPVAGNEDNKNTNRRTQTTKDDTDSPASSTTALMLGTRIYYGPVQLVGQLDPGYLLRGPNFLSGAQGNMWFWVSLVYDWDYDQDTESGNGSQKYAPHAAEKGAPAGGDVHLPPKEGAAPAAPATPAPAPAGQEFDS
ncbi:MAG: hypothetical protein HY903_13220 [Deltaproteobacteria bacterium]|nr:hypothetical protein [Deltaproteobacteria bacterium]